MVMSRAPVRETNTRRGRSVKGADNAEFVVLKAHLTALIRKEEEGGYFIFCPALDVGTQGETIAEAKKNIAEAAQCFLEGCYEMGTLNEVLLKRGFRSEKKITVKNIKHSAGSWDKVVPFQVPAKFPLAAS